jgi:hypothetical protein
MPLERQTDLIAKSDDASLDDRAVWTAPILQHFDTVSAGNSGNYGADSGYGGS